MSLVIFDFDGVLSCDGESMPPYISAMLEDLRRKGVLLGLASHNDYAGENVRITSMFDAARARYPAHLESFIENESPRVQRLARKLCAYDKAAMVKRILSELNFSTDGKIHYLDDVEEFCQRVKDIVPSIHVHHVTSGLLQPSEIASLYFELGL